jgi:cytochrome P450
MKYVYPPGYSFLGTYRRALKLVNNPIESMVESIAHFGDTYTVYSGLSRRMILTQDQEFIEYVLKKNHKNYYKSDMVSKKLGQFIGNGLLTSNGPYWLQQRRLIQPGFHLHKIQGLYEIMKKTIDGALAKFPTGRSVDVLPVLNRLAFDIVIHTLFDIELPAGSMRELSTFISETQEFVIRDIRQPHKSWWYKLSGEVNKNKRKAQRARDILRDIIRQRQEKHRKFNDLLDMLLDARYEDTGNPMNEEQILDEILILIIAGHETTANALTWTLFLLAQHPRELERLRTDTMSAAIMDCVTNERLTAVINESMRLFPPAWVSDRVALDDDSFNGYRYPKGTVLVLFYYGLHRNEHRWESAAAFRPDRFLRKEGAWEKPKAFYPFGGGPRLCIGNNFAMAEMALFLQAFIHRFDIELSDVSPRMKPLVTLRPEGVVLGITPRLQTPLAGPSSAIF